jgi:competence protein ComEA
MTFYRTFIAAVAAMGLATAVFADDNAAANAAAQNPAADATQQTTQAAQVVADNSAVSTDATASTDATQAATIDQAKVDLNKATAKDLMQVKGLNASKAKAIVSFRKKHGDFKSVDDLKEVKGFKKLDDDSLKSIQDQLTVG